MKTRSVSKKQFNFRPKPQSKRNGELRFAPVRTGAVESDCRENAIKQFAKELGVKVGVVLATHEVYA
ncbi:MAG: hypothetical protein KBB55_01170 [Candidatus Buchananbacteria bacterium]|nr:hypothetical protein [Candidatus Buchananbacteria bacterium]